MGHSVDHWGAPMEDHLEDLRAAPMEDHLESLMEGRLVVRKVDHLEGLMEVQTVTLEGLLLFERLVLLDRVQVVQQVVKEEAMWQAQVVPE